MNLVNYPRKKYSINQFTQPRCTELEGQSFHFIMDDGRDFDLEFKGDDIVLWNWTGDAPTQAKYQCLKGDETTYLVDYILEETRDTQNRTNHLFVIDMEQRLVTRGIFSMGHNPRFPYIISGAFSFGAIDVVGKELPFKRHYFTTDLVGTRVEWHWGTTTITRHSYYSTSFYRYTYPGEDILIERDVSLITHMDLPSQDEYAQYIKIKHNMYLFCLTEELAERTFTVENPPFRSNNMCFLQNYDRMYHVGRTFGNVFNATENKIIPSNIQFGAFGNPVEIPEVILNADNPYVT